MPSQSLYKKDDCVLITSGLGWPDDNTRPGRSDPEDFGENSIGYVEATGRERTRLYVVGKQRVYWVSNDDFETFDPTTTGIRTDEKICKSCVRLKYLSDFSNNQTNAKGERTTRPRCKDCFKTESGPGLTKTVREAFQKSVGAPEKGDLWRCPVCKKVGIAEVNVTIVVDHDQERYKPRGLICDPCNTGLGRFRNGEDHLQDVIRYLQEYEASLE